MKLQQPVDREDVRRKLQSLHDAAQRESSLFAGAALMLFLLGCLLPGAASFGGCDVASAPTKLAKGLITLSLGRSPSGGASEHQIAPAAEDIQPATSSVAAP